MFDIRRFEGENEESESPILENNSIVTPGTIISSDVGFMRGHGTWIDEENKICATVAGTIEKINKLYTVKPQRSRYVGEVGDVVVGRIVEVQHKRWAVDINARLNAILLLSSVNLPGGELRRKTEQDELMMRHYLEVGDLINAEVQSIFSDGSLSLHTRSLKYGKLSQGQLVKVPASLVQRKKTHFHNIVSGIQIILSNNGYIWISPSSAEDVETGGFVENLERVSKEDRESISRIRNCILALTRHNKLLSDTIILYAYDASLVYEGSGTQFYKDGSRYEGAWKKDLRHGQGKMEFKNGSTYVGHWVRDSRSGKGMISNSDGSFFRGDWCNNKFDGQGIFVAANGDRFDGRWREMKKCGEGKYLFKNSGMQMSGIWMDDMFSCGIIELADPPTLSLRIPPCSLLNPEKLLRNMKIYLMKKA